MKEKPKMFWRKEGDSLIGSLKTPLFVVFNDGKQWFLQIHQKWLKQPNRIVEVKSKRAGQLLAQKYLEFL